MVRLLALAALIAAAPASAAVAPSFGAFEPVVADALQQVKAAAPRWTPVDMTVSSASNFVMVTEPSLRIDVNGSGSIGNGWFSGTAGGDDVSFGATAFGRGWALLGSGVNVTMVRFGNGWAVSGDVGGVSLSYELARFGSTLEVSGQSGAHLNVSGWSNDLHLSGQIDPARVDAKALAVIGATLALGAD